MNYHISRFLLTIPLFTHFVTFCNGAPTQLKVGIAKENITPDIRVKNWITGLSYDFVHDSIYVRALALDDGITQSIILSWDLVNAGESATAEVRKRISEKSGIVEDNILVNATHNHSAPWSPEYKSGFRGQEADPWWVVRYMPPQYEDPIFKLWMEELIEKSVKAVDAALNRMQTVTMWISRSDISSLVQNRRPRNVDWGIVESSLPDQYNYKHPDWNPKVLGNGASFGPVDRTMTVLSFRNKSNERVATILQMTAHAVAIYPYLDGISADWPGATLRKMQENFGGECLYLQGTAGDINPGRRGEEAVEQMSTDIAAQAEESDHYASRLETGPLICRSTKVGIPLTERGREITGLKALDVEIQVINIGPLAIVTLPGEPMTAIGMAIREQSPFPQTLVLGYSNGSGVYYVGMPGEKKYAGYETGENTNLGTDVAGSFLAQTAVMLLKEIYSKKFSDE